MKNISTHLSTQLAPIRLGVLLNPYAGVGGQLALKGSDSLSLALLKQTQGQVDIGQSHAQQRLAVVMKLLQQHKLLPRFDMIVAPAQLAEHVLQALNIPCQALNLTVDPQTSADDTVRIAKAMLAEGIDLLLFAGGDGTARDVCRAVGLQVPVLGVPAGVKMHSGVFAINPQAAVDVLQEIAFGHWVAADLAEVRDIDETDLAQGRLKARHYGEMRVPALANHIQQVKCSGREVEALVVAEIAAGFVENMRDNCVYALGPGTTVAAVAEQLGLENTLLGFDLVQSGQCLVNDVTADELLRVAAEQPLIVVIAPTGGQGSLIGRGNQQLSAPLLHKIGRDNVQILSSASKLAELDGRPLRLDTGDAALDKLWSGLWCVHTGYQQQVLYAVQG
ncbi:MAG: ATP-NAD kinase family protein [Moraxellaceae bacterium]|nr:ATP-NAD kinase family protein [Moraxellaceae bacterium]MDZ4297434.1 ATP-NAD kinase family protein [Moraxellaceae bacterium]MDZ4387419.1 ATP-NAD kinase family protein [Moraxellaceae bacterium]